MAANEAIFYHGDPLMVDYTPGSACPGGQINVIGDLPLPAHRDIAANEKGALACGGGVYKILANAAIAEGLKVYWDNAAKRVTVTSSGNKVFGYVVPGGASSGAGAIAIVWHQPEAA